MKRFMFWGCSCWAEKGQYADGKPALLLFTDAEGYRERAGMASLNVPIKLALDEIVVKNYSENEGLLEILEREGIVKATGREIVTGFTKSPICRVLI